MIRDPIVLAALGVLAVVAVTLTLALLQTRSRTRQELAAARAESAALRAQVDEIERRLAARAPEPTPSSSLARTEYTITDLGAAAHPVARQPRIDQALFADLVLRETVVRAASLAHGVRRALGAESRNRVRFEVRREVRRSRKQRRADLREARRDWEARQRGALDGEDAA